MIDGILSIHKQEGITSYDVIRRLKKALSSKEKIGHAGTLDPFATGLLIILFGKATKMMNTFHAYEKVYQTQGTLGFTTDTQDITGKVISKDTSKEVPTKEEIEKIVEENFLGEILQTPPNYSAKKVDGKRAYDLARQGEEFKLEPKQISVSQFEISSYEYPLIECKIVCSTGTYVRTLIHDLGIVLGTYATCTKLERVSIGGFHINEAIKSEDITQENRENIVRRIVNV